MCMMFMPSTQRTRRALFFVLSAIFLGAVAGRAGTLVGSFARISAGADIDLTAAGPLDWVHWGLHTDSSVDRKANVTPQISDFVLINPNTNAGTYAFQFSDNANGYSWNDGSPTLAVDNTPTGVWAYGFPVGFGVGFELTVPADSGLKTLKMYVGAYGARGRFEAVLSDASAPPYVSTQLENRSNGSSAIYTIQYAANSARQHLRIRYTADFLFSFTQGNVTLQAAALNAEGANSPPNVALTAPAQNSTHTASTNIVLTASASDPDGQVQRVEFFAGNFRIGTDSDGSYAVTWSDVPAGLHVLTAVAYDNSGNLAVSRPVEIWVHGSGGMLAAALEAPPPSTVDLTSQGTLDWVHWGTFAADSVDRKAAVPARISNYVQLGSNPIARYSNNHTGFSWSDGTPTLSATGSRTGIFVTGHTNGFRLTVPADTLPKRLKIYVGLYGARGNFRAYLTDFSAPAYLDATLDNLYDDSYGVYTIDYQAASSGQELIVQYQSAELYDVDYGNVTLQSATLSGQTDGNLFPTVSITTPTNDATFFVGANIPITAEASDSDGTIAKVEFFNGAMKLGEATNAPFSMTWSNVASGTYSLTAKALDNVGAATTSPAVGIQVLSRPILRPELINPRWHNGVFTFQIETEAGRTYTLLYTPELNPPDWHSLNSFSGNGSAQTVTNSVPAIDERFYQIRVD